MLHRAALFALAAAVAGCAVASPPAPSSPPEKLPPGWKRVAGAARPKEPAKAPRPPFPDLAGIKPCAQGSAEHEAASTKLKALKVLMKAKKGAAFAEAVPAIKELLASPCYARLALEPEAHLRFDGPLALEKWWDAGAPSWLEVFLSAPLQGTDRNTGQVFDFFSAPDVRHVLDEKAIRAADATPALRALGWLVCPDGEVDCGRQAAGWLKRADDAFAALAYEEAFRTMWQRDMADETLPTRKTCEKKVLAADLPERFRVFRTCFEDVQLRQWAMPLGRFRTPDAGWLIVRGRRGHYEFCDEMRAYDLATGAAFIAQSCSGLQLDSGLVDHQKVDAARKVRVTMGSLPLDNLRELALVLLLAPEVEPDLVLDPRWIDLPEGIPAVLSEGPRIERSTTQQWWSSAAQRAARVGQREPGARARRIAHRRPIP